MTGPGEPPPDGSTSSENELEDLLREARLEERDLHNEIEFATEIQERAGRSLVDMLYEYLVRADLVRVYVGRQSWVGTISSVTTGLLTLSTSEDTTVHAGLDHVSAIRVVE